MVVKIEQALIRRRQVEIETSLRRAAIYRTMREMTFPQAVRVGAHFVGWCVEIDAWLADPASYSVER
jgi:prophage regulatory protein